MSDPEDDPDVRLRGVREDMDGRIRQLERALQDFDWEAPTAEGQDAVAIQHRYERLLRLRQLREKLLIRERVATRTRAG